ncbi:MFS transporter [Microbacterium sp. NPDC079995]|uniref:MFS transporter n=1 Tax=unclassified Microbacterium TaxID=2609290 RepID=UPI003451024B
MSDATLTARRTVALSAAGISLIAACYGLARFAYGLFVPAFRSTFELDGATIGAIAAMSYVAYGAGILYATVATPRLGARFVSVSAGGLGAIGCALIAAAPTPGILALGVAVAGSSTGVASPPLAQVVARRVREQRRDRVQTIINAGTGLGVLVSGPVALLAGDQWRLAWAAFAVLCAATAVWVGAVVPSAADAGKREPRARPRIPAGATPMVSAAVVVGLGTGAVWTFGQDLLQGTGGQSAQAAAVVWIVLGACGLGGALAGGVIGRAGIVLTWRMLVVAASVATAVLAFAPSSFLIAAFASGVFGAVYIAVTGVLLVWSTRIFVESPATGVGAAFLALALGQALGSPLIGWVADLADLRVAIAVAAGLGLGALVFAPPRHP